MKKKVLVPIAEGTEEMEAVCIIDILRRADTEVVVASVSEGLQVTASRGVKIIADKMISDCLDEAYDLVVLPGGIPGAEHLRDSDTLTQILTAQAGKNGLYGAICASPAVVLEHHGLLDGRKATCHPAFVEKLADQENVENRVVVDGNCITSRGPGTAMEFALELVEVLYGKEKRDSVAGPMVI